MSPWIAGIIIVPLVVWGLHSLRDIIKGENYW